MPEVFLSYSRNDQPVAKRFAEALQREGFSVWWDQALNPGEAFDQVTEKALEEAKAVVVLWSKHSVDSRWVRAEATQAQAAGRLVPVMIEPCKRPIMFELTHTADLSGWSGNTGDSRWQPFVDSLRGSVGKKRESTPATPAAPSETQTNQGRPSARRIGWIALAAALVIAAGLFWLQKDRTTIRTATVQPTIAVLPFENLSSDPEQQHFADGLTEEILNSLASVPDLKVTARTSSFYYKDHKENLKTIGETLDVAHVLEGSVRRSGDQLRIVAQLNRTDTGFHDWSKIYERPFTDVFAIQQDIARSVAEALQVTLGVGIAQQLGMTRNMEAYEAYLSAVAQQGKITPESATLAAEYLRRATTLDPGFAHARVQLITLYANISNNSLEPERRSEFAQKASAELAELQKNSPGSPLVSLAQARVAKLNGEWRAGGGYFRAYARAVPFGVEANETGDQELLTAVGRPHDVLAMIEHQVARDPLNLQARVWLALGFGSVGRFPEAFREIERVHGGDSPFKLLSTAIASTLAMGARDREGVIKWTQASIDAGNPLAEINRELLRNIDKPEEARKLLVMHQQDKRMVGTGQSFLAVWLAYFDDPEDALRASRAAYQTGAPVAAAANLWQPVMRDMRKLPEFHQLVRDIGLVEYWKEFGWGDWCKPIEGTDDFECS